MTEPTAPIETELASRPSTTQVQPESKPKPADGETEPGQKPRITIQYCTQCKWMLRAAYFAQELLSTFSTDLSEVALIPRTGGIFTVTIYSSSSSSSSADKERSQGGTVYESGGQILWDRKADGGFPEVKVLKSRVRNVIDPSRDLGHTDRALKKDLSDHSGLKDSSTAAATAPAQTINQDDTPREKSCEDCQ
ncbi:Rdx family-domain-containing protein [Aspergillus californicus]